MDKVSGVILLVSDIQLSAECYKKLGFTVRHEKADIEISVQRGDFWLELLDKNKTVTSEYIADAGVPNKGSGIYLQVEVQDVDTFHDKLTRSGIETASTPQDYPWGKREFTVTDPDGYKLTFFSMLPEEP